MRPGWYQLCRMVMRLDRIPRYGRFYQLARLSEVGSGEEEGASRFASRKAQWRWQRNGRWGMNLLVRWDMFWDYVDEARRRGDRPKRREKLLDFKAHPGESWSMVAIAVLMVLSVGCLIISMTLL